MTLLKVKAGRIYQPFRENARFPIEYAMAQRLGLGIPTQFGGRGFLRGVKVNDISPLPPMNQLRAIVQKFAKQFVSDYTRRGFTLNQPEDEMVLWGPYRPRDFSHAGGSTMVAVGYSDPVVHAQQRGVVDMLLSAEFIRHQGFEIDPLEFRQSNAPALAAAMVAERERIADREVGL